MKKIVLASAWHPRGELDRFERLFHLLEKSYLAAVITFPPDTDPSFMRSIEDITRGVEPSFELATIVTPEWSWGCYLALKSALDIPAEMIQYADFDRLLRWVETQPAEWQRAQDAITDWDCLVIGRTPDDYATHPKALTLTEEIGNLVTSFDRNLHVTYRQGDMRMIDFDNQFDIVLLLFTAFGYFDDEENSLVLRKIAHSLKPGGKLLLDIQNRDRFIERMIPFFVTEKEGNLMIDRITYDELTRRMYNKQIVIRDGVRRDKPFFIRMYNQDEIREMLLNEGLIVSQVLGGWDGLRVTSDSNRLILVAQKPLPE